MAAGLLLAEYLLTSYAVDVRPLAAREDWLSAFGSAGTLGPIVLSVLTATLVVGGRPLLLDLGSMLDRAPKRSESRSVSGRLGSLVVHLTAFGTFLFLTVRFAGATDELPRGANFLAAAWIASLVICLVALLHSLVSFKSLRPVALRAGPALAIGVPLGLAAWAAGVATVRFWDPLGEATLRGTAAVLRTFSSDIVFDAATSTLTLESFTVVISAVCSGYEGIGLMTVLISAYLLTYRARLRFPNVLVLLPIGIVLSWVANLIRISALMLVGARWSQEVALGSFHSKAGWVLFCALALGIVFLSRNAAVFSRDTGTAKAVPTWNPTAAYLTPLLALVAVQMVTGIFSTGFPHLYGLAILAAAACLWAHRRSYAKVLRPLWSWEACAFGFVTFAIWIALEPSPDPVALNEWREGMASLSAPAAGLWIAVRLLGSVIIVPIAEELAFRGYLLRRLASADFTNVAFSHFAWFPFLVSSIAFGFLHQRWIAGIVAGVLFALAQIHRGRLGSAVLAHSVANFLIAIYAIALENWALWS